MKVKYKLPLVVVLLSVFPILLVSFIAIYLIDDLSKEDFNIIITNQSKASIKHISDFYYEQKNSISYAAQVDIYKAFVLANANKDKAVRDSLYEQVSKFQKLSQNNNDFINQAYIINLSGTVLVSSDNAQVGLSMSQIPAFNQCIKTKEITFEVINDHDRRQLFMFCPIFDDKKQNVLGILAREINIDYISKYIRDLKVGKSGYQYVFDNNGNILTHHYSSRNTTSSSQDSKLSSLLSLVDNIKNDQLEDKEGFFEYVYNGDKMLAFYQQLPANKWVVVSVVPYKEITQSTTAMRYALLLSSAVVIILALFVGLKIALFFTSSLDKVIKRVMLIESGNFDVQTPAKTNDEFDILHDNITTMAFKLQASYRQLSDSAKIDVLTGIFNRNALYEVMDNKFNNKSNQAALLVDLDGFKAVNDTWGHDYGDDVLISVANVLCQLDNSNLVVARLGGDEFCIFVTNFSNKEEVVNIAKSLFANICNIKTALDKPINISASIGIAFVDKNDSDKSSLIKKADLAMYDVKKSGKGNYCVFNTPSTLKYKS